VVEQEQKRARKEKQKAVEEEEEEEEALEGALDVEPLRISAKAQPSPLYRWGSRSRSSES
jgi:hypothetical protein